MIDQTSSSFRPRRSNRQRQTASFRHDFCDMLCLYGGPELFGFYLALKSWMPDGTLLVSPEQDSIERLGERMGIGVDRFWQLAGRLYECGLLEIQALDNRPLSLDHTVTAIFIIHDEPPAQGRLRKIRDLIGRVNQSSPVTAETSENGIGSGMPFEAVRKRTDVPSQDAVVVHKPVEAFLALSEAEQVGELYERFRQAFGGGAELSRSECERLVAWLEDWPAVMLLLALEEALLHSARSFRYIDRILLNWRKQRIETPEQVLASQRERDEKQEISAKGGKEDHGGKKSARRRSAALRFGQRPAPGAWQQDEELW